MFDLVEFEDLVATANLVVFDQCMYGGITKKPTMILYEGASMHRMEVSCNHIPGAHPQSVQVRSEDGNFATVALAKYPSDINKILAKLIADCVAGMHGKVLVLFSGEVDRVDGLPFFLVSFGVPVIPVDIENKHLADQDISDEVTWAKIREQLISGETIFLFFAPPWPHILVGSYG